MLGGSLTPFLTHDLILRLSGDGPYKCSDTYVCQTSVLIQTAVTAGTKPWNISSIVYSPLRKLWSRFGSLSLLILKRGTKTISNFILVSIESWCVCVWVLNRKKKKINCIMIYSFLAKKRLVSGCCVNNTHKQVQVRLRISLIGLLVKPDFDVSNCYIMSFYQCSFGIWRSSAILHGTCGQRHRVYLGSVLSTNTQYGSVRFDSGLLCSFYLILFCWVDF